MTEKTAALKKDFEMQIAAAKTTAELEALRVSFLGKKGFVTSLMQGLKDIPNEKKREAGQAINTLKQFIEGELDNKKEDLAKLEWQQKIDCAECYILAYDVGVRGLGSATLGDRRGADSYLAPI